MAENNSQNQLAQTHIGNTPSSPSAFLSRFLTTTNLAIAAIVLAFLLPPVGLALVIAVAYRAGQQGKRVVLALGILAILAAFGGLVMYSRIYSNVKDTQQSTYSYKTFEEFIMSSYGSGNGLSISKPVEFKSAVPSTSASSLVVLRHTQTGKSGYSSLSSIALSVSNLSGTTLADIFKDQSADLSKRFTQSLAKYVQIQTGAQESAELGSAKEFTNDNIKENAWRFDFSGLSASLVDGKKRDLNGTLIVAQGKNVYYQVLITSVDANWQSNQDAWKKIIASIKIDQS